LALEEVWLWLLFSVNCEFYPLSFLT